MVTFLRANVLSMLWNCKGLSHPVVFQSKMSPLTFYTQNNKPPSNPEVTSRRGRRSPAKSGRRLLSSFWYLIGDLLTLSGSIFFLPSNEMKCKQAGRPPRITAAADERIIKLLIFNLSFRSLFKKALSAARPQTDLHWLLFVQHFLCQLPISPLLLLLLHPSVHQLLSAACQTLIWPLEKTDE